MIFVLYGLGGAAIIFGVAAAIYVFVVLPFKGLAAVAGWSERKRQRQAERDYYRLPKILGGDGN